MRLDQKYFVPFMVAVAVITAVVIVFSSFNFMEKQNRMFKESIAESDSLLIKPLPKIGESGDITLNQYTRNETVLVFWASWSEKSESLLGELQNFQLMRDSLNVIAAVVMDAEESLPTEKVYQNFVYADGTQFFNDLKVPGIPSYILFGEGGEVLHAHVGYQKGAGSDTLKTYLQ